jgi:hypothetical protein
MATMEAGGEAITRWDNSWGYGVPGRRLGWAQPYGYDGDYFYGAGSCSRWIGGQWVWVC